MKNYEEIEKIKKKISFLEPSIEGERAQISQYQRQLELLLMEALIAELGSLVTQLQSTNERLSQQH